MEAEWDLADPFVCAGNRVYLIGSQHGLFPDLGDHIKGEMGGIWDHPIKLLDGFWFRLFDVRWGVGTWLDYARRFVAAPFYQQHFYEFPEFGLNAVRTQFVPDDQEGLVVYLDLENSQPGEHQIELTFLGRTELLPVWLSDRFGIKDADDTGAFGADGVFVGRDSANPWFVVFGGSQTPSQTAVSRDLWGPEQTAGRGISGQLTYSLKLAGSARQRLTFAIAGSSQSADAARQTFDRLIAQHADLWDAKSTRYQSILDSSDLTVPDPTVEVAFKWIKFNYDWLIRKVPSIGEGLGAGLPEWPWWLGCDTTFALFGLIATGQFERAQNALDLLARVSDQTNGNGRIIHEVSSNGAVWNPGNTEETPHFVKAVWHTFCWTGDLSFLQRMYPRCKRGLEWLFGAMDPDGDLLPAGSGIMETPGLDQECLDSAVYGWEALGAASDMAKVLGDDAGATSYAATAERLRQKIESGFWIESDGLYADMVGTRQAIRVRVPDYQLLAQQKKSSQAQAIVSLLAAKLAADGGPGDQEIPLLLKNWIVVTPMEAGLTTPDRAARALQRLESNEFTGPWGLYVWSFRRDTMMTLSSGVMAVAEATYGRADQALRYVKYIASTIHARTPGAPSEEPPRQGSFVQAWSGYGVIWPIVTHFLGIQPQSHVRKILLKPRPPSTWDRFSIRNVRVASNAFDWSYDGQTYNLASSEAGWNVTLNLPISQLSAVLVDGWTTETRAVDGGIEASFLTTGKTQSIQVVQPGEPPT
jgi:glycogen debranching enzyme